VLYQLAFRSFSILPIFRATVWVSGICGVLAALVARWFTHGEGATLSWFVTPTVAVICATTIRAYLGFAKKRSPQPLSAFANNRYND
jgi:phosphoglycerol transferase MdoB-like AlkP superfamily enzyme